ncbi:MAG: rRNA maturation RNase YbeY [Bacteroidaceae bacterium]|nr:rRNA maturation RNase YbeY [Bacteroidaceae bacterium]
MITYNIQGVLMPDIAEAEVSAWVRSVARSYDKVIGDVNYIFVDDETMLDINRRFIGHDYYTDHIGFDYSQGNALSGDIYISLDTVRSNAELYGVTFNEELRRIIIHGLLHLCGLRDKTPEERASMQEAEDKALKVISPARHSV